MIPCASPRPVATSSPTAVNGTARNGSVFAAASRGRSSWSGLLRVSLVAVPVKAYPAIATDSKIPAREEPAQVGVGDAVGAQVG